MGIIKIWRLIKARFYLYGKGKNWIMKALVEKFKMSGNETARVRYLFFVIFFCEIIYAGIRFMNAGVNYEQAVAFRLFCIGFGALVLSMMEIKQWMTIWSLLYLPACYFYTHAAYQKHWIADTCEYQYVDVIRMGKLVVLVWGIVLIAIVYDMIKNRRLGIRSFHPLLGGIWLAFIVLLTIFKKEYFYATFFVICMTSFYWVMTGNQRQRAVWKALQDAVILSFFYVSFMSLMRRPYDCERYTTYFVNANMAGMYLASVIVVLFNRIDLWMKKWREAKKYIVGLIIYYIMLGFACSLAIFNYTRTTIMGLVFAFFVLFILQMLRSPKKRKVLLQYGLVIVSVASLFHATYYSIRYIPAYMNVPYFFMGEYNPETRVVKGDPIDSPKYTTIESFLTLAFGKWGIYIPFTEEAKEESNEVVIDTERDVTNGRIDIWKAYLEKTNWEGHYPGHITLESGYFTYHAHSTYIHVLYQYGILTGVIYALLNFCAFVVAVCRYWKKGQEEDSHDLLMAVLLIGICLMSQVTEWMGHPAYVINMMLFMMYGMLLCDPREKDQVMDVGRSG